MRYVATVHFINDSREPLVHQADSSDKARIEALQKAKLTGHEPKSVVYDTDAGMRALDWATGETLSRDEYHHRFFPEDD
jgi:hypothetical protein